MSEGYEPVITSTKNPRVRAALDLRDRRPRDDAGATLVDGIREVTRAMAGGARLLELFADEDRLDAEGLAVVGRARAGGARITIVGPAVLERLAYGDRSDGVVAVAAIPDMRLAALRLPHDPLVVVLEGVEKPGNLGAVLRSADGAGADAVIAADPRTDLFNPNAVRASIGTIFSVPVAAGTSVEVRARLADAGARIVAARVDGLALHTEVDLRGPVAIVLGSEAGGLSGAWNGPDIIPVRLPMLGVADSLNVSIAAAVLLYEARRQRDAG
ncbi:MAG: RNA methyltransferase [Chloroflexota bacterium]